MAEPQSFANHARYVPAFHVGLVGVVLVAFVTSVTFFVRTLMRGWGRLESVTLVLLVIACGLLAWYARTFALKAQDRAIRAEEGLRHLILTGQPLDRRLGLMQIVALRFASDEELPALARRAAEEGMKPGAIKRVITSWRADHDRV